MELANIEKLLEKYLEAETTLQEENILRDYFTSGNVAPHLQEFGMLFGYFKQSQSEAFTQTIKLKPEIKKKKSLQWMSIAASVALLFSVFIGKQQYDKQQQRKQFAQIKEALLMVSSNLNKGNDAIYAVSDNINKGSNAVNEISTFSETIKTANNIINKTN